MANHNVKQLEKEFCEYYEGDDDDLKEYIDDEDHFTDVAYWVAKSLGFVNVTFSECQQSYYDDDWTESDCNALGKVKRLVWMLDENKSNTEYLVHAIVEAPTWVLGKDNREAPEKKLMALCIQGDSGDESVYSQMHEVGKCPECLYEHEIMIDKKIKVTATVYIRVKGKDRHSKFDGLFDDAIDSLFHKTTVEDNLHDELYYEMDDEVTISAKVHKVQTKAVPRTREI